MLLAEQSLKGIDIGSKQWFDAQRRILQTRSLLRRCYVDWYSKMLADEATVPESQPGILLELGSGGSFLSDLKPGVMTSDVVDGVAEQVIDARTLPFPDASVRAIFMTHAFHHVPSVEQFLSEAQRALVPGGVISMIEVARSPLACLLFGHFHPEPYVPDAPDWSFPEGNNMMSANQALSWIVFDRDLERFHQTFPDLTVECRQNLPWFNYLVSGGVTRRPLLPRVFESVVAWVDRVTAPLGGLFALHWHIRIRKRA